jgi:hypothetical protein
MDQPLRRPPIVPKEFAGQWIAWDRAQTQIIASGRTFAEVHQAAVATGELQPLMAKVPKADARFIGGVA